MWHANCLIATKLSSFHLGKQMFFFDIENCIFFFDEINGLIFCNEIREWTKQISVNQFLNESVSICFMVMHLDHR